MNTNIYYYRFSEDANILEIFLPVSLSLSASLSDHVTAVRCSIYASLSDQAPLSDPTSMSGSASLSDPLAIAKQAAGAVEDILNDEPVGEDILEMEILADFDVCDIPSDTLSKLTPADFFFVQLFREYAEKHAVDVWNDGNNFLSQYTGKHVTLE